MTRPRRTGRPAWPTLPPHAPGMRIGLYGGSFNPPHAAHRAVALEALRRLALDAIWVLVTPGNPLKEESELRPLAERLRATRRMIRHPRVAVTAIERDLGTRFTVDTVRELVRRAPRVRFVWIMGADNLESFHRWGGWREIADLVPIAVFDRPGFGLAAGSAKFAVALSARRLPEGEASRLAGTRPPAWLFLHQRLSPLSSTKLRQGVLKSQRSAP